jgi:hypothetical protein
MGLVAPVSIGILETPSGFEVNAVHGWPERMEEFFKNRFVNYHPRVTRIRAWRRDGQNSTNSAVVVDPILLQEYLYCGAGSPTYLVKHLVKSRAYKNLTTAQNSGTAICLGSAGAIAAGRYALPVYEIFKVGEGLHWVNGLNFLGTLGLQVVIIPHWNNTEGGDFDTTRCFMGDRRFRQLVKLLPTGIPVIGIDELTALIFDPAEKSCDVLGIGSVHILSKGKERMYEHGRSFTFGELLSVR